MNSSCNATVRYFVRVTVSQMSGFLQTLFFKNASEAEIWSIQKFVAGPCSKSLRNQESSVHAELRRQQQAQRQSVLRAAETLLHS
ncbi:hypothetical protein TNCV_4665801 [Trichonephila clavipes]|nr:hypothetical protein TNCV_4665801 [Trichonephila clavipes]